MIKYYIILFISWLGIPTGWWLARKAWDEVSQYKNILKTFRILTLTAIAFLMMTDPLMAIALSLAWAIMYYKDLNKWIYASLPIALWLSFPIRYFPYVASLILFYGFIEGSLQTKKLSRPKTIDAMLQLCRDNFAYLAVGVIIGIAL